MAGICFYFERYDVDVWSGRNIDLDAWNYACKAAGDINKVFVINKTEKKIRTFDAELKENFKVFDDLPRLDGKVVYVCCPWDNIKNKTSLWNFDHDVDWYVFGPASGWRQDIENGIYIPQSGVAALHSTHIASVVLLHRHEVIYGNHASR